mgnify:CR=1 FL=1
MGIYTRDKLIDPNMMNTAFNILDQRENAARENRAQWANLWGTVANEAANVGKAYYEQKQADKRLASIEDENEAYKDDPLWKAAKQQYAKTGDINGLNTARSLFNAEQSRKATEESNRLKNEENAREIRNAKELNYKTILADYNTNKQKLGLINDSELGAAERRATLQGQIEKNKLQLEDLGRSLYGDEWTLPELEQSNVPQVQPEQPVQPQPETTTYSSVRNLANDIDAKGTGIKYADILQLEQAMSGLNKQSKEYEAIKITYNNLKNRWKTVNTNAKIKKRAIELAGGREAWNKLSEDTKKDYLEIAK